MHNHRLQWMAVLVLLVCQQCKTSTTNAVDTEVLLSNMDKQMQVFMTEGRIEEKRKIDLERLRT